MRYRHSILIALVLGVALITSPAQAKKRYPFNGRLSYSGHHEYSGRPVYNLEADLQGQYPLTNAEAANCFLRVDLSLLRDPSTDGSLYNYEGDPLVQTTGANQGIIADGYVMLDGNDYYVAESLLSLVGGVSRYNSQSPYELYDSGQDFTNYTGYKIIVTHEVIPGGDDGSIAFGYIESVVSGTTAVVYQEASLTTPGWNCPGGGVPLSGVSIIQSYRVEQSVWSQIGDVTWITAVRPNDGQPALRNVIDSKGSDLLHRSYIFDVTDAGKIRYQTSDDGSNLQSFTTDDSVFSDGAQSNFTLIAVSKSGASAKIYVSGIEQAASGTVYNTLYDTAKSVIIGALNDGSSGFLSGDILLIIGFSTALSSPLTRIQRVETFKRRP